MHALQRLIATQVEAKSALTHVREVEGLYDALKKRLPAVLNQTDYTIGFKCEMGRVLRVLDLLGFTKTGSHGTTVTLKDAHHEVQVMEPREGWNPVLQVLN